MAKAKNNQICLKCGNPITYPQDCFVPVKCDSCGRRQILQFNRNDLHFERLIASSPLFYIYKGYHTKHKLFLLVTVLRKDIKDYEWNLNMIEEQATALTALSHINICPLFSHGTIDDYYYIAHPRMDGYRLSSYDPSSHDLMDINRVIEVLQPAALGMAVAHFHEFTHHNITPESIHIDDRGMVRVNDFFLARFIYAYDQRRIKLENKISTSISPLYISPEKAESGVEDHRGDIFSFGVMIYFFLTGKYPFIKTKEAETIYTRIKQNSDKENDKENLSNESDAVSTYIAPVAPKEYRPEVPDDLSKLIMQMLSYYPNSRPSFSEIITVFNMLRAKLEMSKTRGLQEDIVDTETRDIPIMRSYAKTLQ